MRIRMDLHIDFLMKGFGAKWTNVRSIIGMGSHMRVQIWSAIERFSTLRANVWFHLKKVRTVIRAKKPSFLLLLGNRNTKAIYQDFWGFCRLLGISDYGYLIATVWYHTVIVTVAYNGVPNAPCIAFLNTACSIPCQMVEFLMPEAESRTLTVVCVRRCRVRLPGCRNARPQCSHANGFSPEWILWNDAFLEFWMQAYPLLLTIWPMRMHMHTYIQ